MPKILIGSGDERFDISHECLVQEIQDASISRLPDLFLRIVVACVQNGVFKDITGFCKKVEHETLRAMEEQNGKPPTKSD